MRECNLCWSIENFPVDQCRHFKYLGITFSDTLSWKGHLEITKSTALKIMGAIPKFYHTKGSFLIDPAIELFQSKIITQTSLWCGGKGMEQCHGC